MNISQLNKLKSATSVVEILLLLLLQFDIGNAK